MISNFTLSEISNLHASIFPNSAASDTAVKVKIPKCSNFGIPQSNAFTQQIFETSKRNMNSTIVYDSFEISNSTNCLAYKQCSVIVSAHFMDLILL